MTLSDLTSLSPIINGPAIWISLFYLARQLRESERNQRALLQQGRAARNADLRMRIADPGLVLPDMRGRSGDTDISALEFQQFLWIVEAVLDSAEDTFFQHHNKLLEDNALESTVAALRRNFRRPGWRAIWKQARSNYASDFVAFVDQIARELPANTPLDQLAIWRTDVAAEKAMPPGAALPAIALRGGARSVSRVMARAPQNRLA